MFNQVIDLKIIKKKKSSVVIQTPPTGPAPPLGKTKMTPARPATPTQVKRNSRLRKVRAL